DLQRGQSAAGGWRPGLRPLNCAPIDRPWGRDALPMGDNLLFNLRRATQTGSPTMAAEPADSPLLEFFQLVPNERPPRRADRAVGGVIPARALRYCEAITSASAFGWYVFLPLSFKIVWDGHDMLWTYEGVDEWLPLTRDAVQYPHFSEQF